jgi:hypothetical protein
MFRRQFTYEPCKTFGAHQLTATADIARNRPQAHNANVPAIITHPHWFINE